MIEKRYLFIRVGDIVRNGFILFSPPPPLFPPLLSYIIDLSLNYVQPSVSVTAKESYSTTSSKKKIERKTNQNKTHCVRKTMVTVVRAATWRVGALLTLARRWLYVRLIKPAGSETFTLSADTTYSMWRRIDVSAARRTQNRNRRSVALLYAISQSKRGVPAHLGSRKRIQPGLNELGNRARHESFLRWACF